MKMEFAAVILSGAWTAQSAAHAESKDLLSACSFADDARNPHAAIKGALSKMHLAMSAFARTKSRKGREAAKNNARGTRRTQRAQSSRIKQGLRNIRNSRHLRN